MTLPLHPCPACGRSTAVQINGRLAPHGGRGGCIGSGQQVAESRVRSRRRIKAWTPGSDYIDIEGEQL